jgi:hypothetical protein
MFCAPRLVFDDTEGVGSHFHVLCSWTRFQRCRVRRVLFSCFALPDSFSAVLRASGPVFLFCAPGLVFDGTEGVGSRFHILRYLTHIWQFHRRQAMFSCFAPGLVFGGTEDFGSRFNPLRSRTNIRRYRGRRVPFSCFVLPDSFSAVPNASGPVFIFCPSVLFFSGIEGVRSQFHVLRARTCFWRYRGRRVPFSCFVLPNTFSAVPRTSGPVFICCSPVLIFGGTEGVGSRFHVLRARTHFRRCRMHQVSFSCRVPFSCFARPDSFSTVPRALGTIFMFCAPGHVFGGAECVGSRFHILRTRNHF